MDKYIPGNELQYAVVEASIMKITILHTNLSARPRVPISVLVIPNTQCMTYLTGNVLLCDASAVYVVVLRLSVCSSVTHLTAHNLVGLNRNCSRSLTDAMQTLELHYAYRSTSICCGLVAQLVCRAKYLEHVDRSGQGHHKS